MRIFKHLGMEMGGSFAATPSFHLAGYLQVYRFSKLFGPFQLLALPVLIPF